MKHYLYLAAMAIVAGQLHGSPFDGNVNAATMDGTNTQWAVNADVLYWKAVEDNFPVAVIIDTVDADTSASLLYPNFKWDVGFRLGASYTPCGCDWDIYASWTHFDTKASRSFGPGSATETIVPQWGSLDPFAADLAVLSSDWHLHLNWADFELNRTFYADPCFSFGVHGGLRAAWVDQKFSFLLTNDATTPLSSDLSSKSDYSSVGVVVGLDASWMMGCGFSVNASAGGALLYGKQKSHVAETLTVGPTVTTVGGSSHYDISRAMSDLRLGVSWQGCVCDCMTVALGVDWEHHILFNQNQFPRGSATSESRPRDGDLTIQGATFSATVFF